MRYLNNDCKETDICIDSIKKKTIGLPNRLLAETSPDWTKDIGTESSF